MCLETLKWIFMVHTEHNVPKHLATGRRGFSSACAWSKKQMQMQRQARQHSGDGEGGSDLVTRSRTGGEQKVVKVHFGHVIKRLPKQDN